MMDDQAHPTSEQKHLLEKYKSVAQSTSSPQDFYRLVRGEGITKSSAAYLLRDLFGMNLEECLKTIAACEPNSPIPHDYTISNKLDDLYAALCEADRVGDNAELQSIIELARKVTGKQARQWHIAALQCENKKWFTQWVYRKQPIRKDLAAPFILAALRETNASKNKYFIDPVLETYGKDYTLALLHKVQALHNDLPSQAMTKALYWAERAPKNSRGMHDK